MADGSQGTIDRPTFVIGTGRCGLSPLMDLLSFHREFAWPSQYNDRFPSRLWLSKLSRVSEAPLLNGPIKFRFGRYVPHHSETFPLWEQVFPGFGRPVRDLTAADVTPHVREGFRRIVAEIQRHQHKRRFIAEYSGWSRVDFLRDIFPDARFIHVVRDGRAVAHSLIHVDYWTGWRGVYQWRWGVPPEPGLRDLERYDHSFLAMAAIQWKLVVRNLLDRTQGLSRSEVKLVRYEDLVRDPIAVSRDCAEFAGVDRDCPHFARHLTCVPIVDANRQRFRIPSWRQNLRPDQIQMLDDLLSEDLERFGYDVTG